MPAIFAIVCDGPAEFERWKLQATGLACIAWGIDELWIVDRCKGDEKLGRVQFHEVRLRSRQVDSLEAAVKMGLEKDLAVTFVHGPARIDNGRELAGFEHPKDALYVFGGDRSTPLWPAFSKSLGQWLSIPASRDVYGFMAASVVAQHRAQQRGAR